MTGADRGRDQGSRRVRACLRALFCAVCAAVLLIGTGFPENADATSKMTVTVPETVKGYTPCEIVVKAPADGEVELTMFDHLQNVWLVRKEQVVKGKNKLAWDGLGANGERMFAGPYRFVAKMKTADGKEYSAEAKFQINGTTQTLVYALPSSDTLYLSGGDRWFVECYVSASCIVSMEVKNKKGKVVYTRDEEIKDPDGVCLGWNGALNTKEKISAGKYTVRMWSKLNPSYEVTFPLTVEKKAPEKPKVGVTGPVTPERGMSDEEIWEIMMKPSVVIDANGTFRRFNLYSAPKTGSKTVGTLRCALQGLEILDTEGAWAHVRAWRHEDGKQVEGYFLLKQLTTYTPAKHYGILIDKREQTLTVFRDGKRIGTVPVSTGLPSKGNLYRETPAGAFLTDVHTGASFAQEGYRYEYPLRYDGGNYIHGVGYVRQGRVRDYSEHLKKLGQKASHGCTRVSLFLEGENSFLNMYWLWTHMPYHTRVIVLDD